MAGPGRQSALCVTAPVLPRSLHVFRTISVLVLECDDVIAAFDQRGLPSVALAKEGARELVTQRQLSQRSVPVSRSAPTCVGVQALESKAVTTSPHSIYLMSFVTLEV